MSENIPCPKCGSHNTALRRSPLPHLPGSQWVEKLGNVQEKVSPDNTGTRFIVCKECGHIAVLSEEK